MPGAARIVASAVLALLTAAFEALAESHSSPAPSIAWSLSEAAHRVEVSPLDSATLEPLRSLAPRSPEWHKRFTVSVEPSNVLDQIGLPPVSGNYRVTAKGIEFQPDFPFEPGVRYRAALNIPGVRPISSLHHLPPPVLEARTRVTQIYPSADVLPENLLKFYLHFSGPMSAGHVYEHIHLRGQDGRMVELPFLEIDEELWSPDMTRLTLFLDPGRIKRGVKPLEEAGPALQAGNRYALIIDSDWRDASGAPLQSSFEKKFRVGPADREPPDPASWTITPPPAGSRRALRVDFIEPMDHALALRMIHVRSADGNVVPCETRLDDHERAWLAAPASPWRAGRYQLMITTTIEDLAGNNIGKPFEVDLFEKVQRRLASETVHLDFEIRP